MAQPAKFSFKPTLDGTDKEKLAEIQGNFGPFYTQRAGGKPEMKNCFYYGDKTCEFFFYANIFYTGDAGNVYDIEVDDATPRRFEGFLVIPQSLSGYIESNIRRLFETRNFHMPSAPIEGIWRPRHISFSWRVFQ